MKKPIEYSIRGNSYIVDTLALAGEPHQQVWKVAFQVEDDQTLISYRIAGDQDEVGRVADQYLNQLCQANPGKLFKYNITVVREL